MNLAELLFLRPLTLSFLHKLVVSLIILTMIRKCVPGLRIVAVTACLIAGGRTLQGQAVTVSAADFATGGTFENYLRVLQLSGKAPAYPWSIRGFSPLELDSLSKGDSAGIWKLQHVAHDGFSISRPKIGAIVNTTFAYGFNDGPVWAGKGLTGVADAGMFFRSGHFSLRLNIIAFRTSNSDFALYGNGQTGALRFGDALDPLRIDMPQRFGAGAYGRLDPGASAARFDSRYFTAGLTTANEWIGPATEYPFLRGNNAAGFPHAFLGTGTPLNVWIGTIHARAMWGKLFQSDYSPVTGTDRFVTGQPSGTVRLATTFAFALTPRGIPGLEIGAARFFHVPFAEGQPDGRSWTKAFKVFFLKNEYAQCDTLGQDNQLASAYFRWAFPKSGFEFYGERGYEDQFHDARDFLEDLDHDRSYMLGFQKILSASPAKTDVLKGELINQQLSNLLLVRVEASRYTHSTLRQGHTNRGELLGANAGLGGAASVLSWTRYSPSGLTGISFRRIVRRDKPGFTSDPKGSDVLTSAAFERTRFHNQNEYGIRVEGTANFNRNFANDAMNLNLQVFTRLGIWTR